MTYEQLCAARNTLNADIDYLEGKLNKLPSDSLEYESAERILNVKYNLLSETCEQIERMEV